jgi:hypothetical protein
MPCPQRSAYPALAKSLSPFRLCRKIANSAFDEDAYGQLKLF